jgi:hypothetical protein
MINTNNINTDNKDKILDISEKDKVYGIIYKMTNIITDKIYVGQTRSHKKNKNKYRPFGHIGRFNEHISEALNNTKNSQSSCLNNSIRKHGKNAFKTEIIELCSIDSLNDRETHYIKNLCAQFPKGYNIREGNREFALCGKIKKNEEPKEPQNKRGRNFGYKHKEETIAKMKKYYEDGGEKIIEKKKETMQTSISNHFANKRAQTLADSDIKLDDKFADLIRPCNKDGKIVSYVIRYNRKKYTNMTGNKYTPEEKYNILYNALKDAYEIRKKGK